MHVHHTEKLGKPSTCSASLIFTYLKYASTSIASDNYYINRRKNITIYTMSSSITNVAIPMQNMASTSTSDPAFRISATVPSASAQTPIPPARANMSTTLSPHSWRRYFGICPSKSLKEIILVDICGCNFFLAVAALVIAGVTFVYGYCAYQLQKWTGLKDYIEYCKDNLVSWLRWLTNFELCWPWSEHVTSNILRIVWTSFGKRTGPPTLYYYSVAHTLPTDTEMASFFGECHQEYCSQDFVFVHTTSRSLQLSS